MKKGPLSEANIYTFFHEEVKPHHKDRQCHFGERKFSIFQGLWCDFFSKWKVAFSHKLFNYCLKGLQETAETVQIFIHLQMHSFLIYLFFSSLIYFFVLSSSSQEQTIVYAIVLKGNCIYKGSCAISHKVLQNTFLERSTVNLTHTKHLRSCLTVILPPKKHLLYAVHITCFYKMAFMK